MPSGAGLDVGVDHPMKMPVPGAGCVHVRIAKPGIPEATFERVLQLHSTDGEAVFETLVAAILALRLVAVQARGTEGLPLFLLMNGHQNSPTLLVLGCGQPC